MNCNEPNVHVKERTKGKRERKRESEGGREGRRASAYMRWFSFSGMLSEKEQERRREIGRSRLSLNHHHHHRRHLRHFISPLFHVVLHFPRHGGVRVGQENPLACLVPSSLPLSLASTHSYIHSSFAHLIFASLLSLRRLFSLSLSTCLSSSVPHTALSHSFFFFVMAKEEKMSSQNELDRGGLEGGGGGWLAAGIFVRAGEGKEGCSTCRASALCTRSSCRCDGWSRQGLSMREQNTKKKKRVAPNEAAGERKRINPLPFVKTFKSSDFCG